MNRLLLFFALLPATVLFSQDPWKIEATKIDPSNYYGVTVANGMIGIVSSPEVFKVKDVVKEAPCMSRVCFILVAAALFSSLPSTERRMLSRLKLRKKLLTLPLPYKSYAPARTTSFTLNGSGDDTMPIIPFATVIP